MSDAAPQPSLQETINQNRMRLVELLKKEKPQKVALMLEKEGWSREWACKAVRTIEIRHNPTNVPHGPEKNQQIRDNLQMHAGMGAGLFVVGLLVSLLSFVFAMIGGGLVIFAYGAIFVGAGMFMRAYPKLKQYPDRKLPLFLPPKDARGARPEDY